MIEQQKQEPHRPSLLLSPMVLYKSEQEDQKGTCNSWLNFTDTEFKLYVRVHVCARAHAWFCTGLGAPLVWLLPVCVMCGIWCLQPTPFLGIYSLIQENRTKVQFCLVKNYNSPTSYKIRKTGFLIWIFATHLGRKSPAFNIQRIGQGKQIIKYSLGTRTWHMSHKCSPRPWEGKVSSLCYTLRKWGSEKLKNFPKVTQVHLAPKPILLAQFNCIVKEIKV